jgi:Flp pilus assembly protein TadG
MREKMNWKGRASGKQKRGQQGQSLVETAAVLPILLLILAVVVDAARAFDAMTILTNAVRQGARYASLEPSPVENQVVDMVILDIEGSGTNVSHMLDFSERGAVEVDIVAAVAVTVTAGYDFPLWFGSMVGFDTLRLEKSATIRHTEEEAGP